MTLTYPFTYPYTYYSGTGSSSAVPGSWPVALAGRTYMVDTAPRSVQWQWEHQSIQLLKPQQDSGTQPSEVSLNPEGLWRRAQESFHLGAGQVWRDKPDADPFRYRSSKGVNPWTPYQLSLLHDTRHIRVDPYVNSTLAVAGNRLYNTNLNGMAYTIDLNTWTGVSGPPASFVTGLTSDGHNVYSSHGVNGIYMTNRHINNTTPFVTGSINGPLAYVNGRLMASDNNNLYNIIAGGAKPAPLFPHPNTDFLWVGHASGPTHIYSAGYSGDKSLIYKTTIKEDGTALDVPTVAGKLPDGELIISIDSYLGFIFLGTTLGIRFCQIGTEGSLNIGAAIPVASCHAFEGQDKYVWFGWTNYDADSSGLGRLSIESFTTSTLTDARVPAYASDLMADGQGVVTSIATFLDQRVFALAGQGIYTEADTYTNGTFDSGLITYGIPDEKVALFVDVRCDPIEAPGRYDVFMSTDQAPFTFVGFDDIVGSSGTQFATSRPAGDNFEVKLDLTPPMTITRYTVKASPGTTDGPNEFIIVPLLLRRFLDINGREEPFDVHAARQHIKRLFQAHTTVKYQEGIDVYDVIVNAYEWFPDTFTTSHTGAFDTPDGTMVTQLKVVN